MDDINKNKTSINRLYSQNNYFFNKTTIVSDYSLESISEALYCGTERFLRNFGLMSLEGFLQSHRTIMRCSAPYLLQDGPHTIVLKVQEATIIPSKTKEIDAETNLELCLLCAWAHRPVER